MADFTAAVGIVLRNEGGYADNPADPGGETNFGISKRQYPDVDIRALTPTKAGRIYRRDYWVKIRGSKIESQDVASNFLDFSINAGVERATKIVQKLVGTSADGVVGPITLRAINESDGRYLNLRLVCARVEYYTELARKRREFMPFLIGWVRRALEYA